MTREILMALMATPTVHVLRLVDVPDGNQVSYSVVCSCEQYESGQFVSLAAAMDRLREPCEIERCAQDAERRRADRLRMQAAKNRRAA